MDVFYDDQPHTVMFAKNLPLSLLTLHVPPDVSNVDAIILFYWASSIL